MYYLTMANEAEKAFTDHVAEIEGLVGRKFSEAQTRAFLIDPVLRILGYKSADDIQMEVQVRATGDFVDYALLIDGKAEAIVEAKPSGDAILEKHAAQCVEYASVLGTRWCLITNGITWAIYDAHINAALADKKIAEVRLVGDAQDANRAWQTLSLFSRESLGKPLAIAPLFADLVIENELLRQDSRAISALRAAVSEKLGARVPADIVVGAVRRRLQGLRPLDTTPGSQGLARTVRAEKPPPRGVTRSDLINAGLLPRDATIEAKFKRETYYARLRDGQVELDGQLYPTLSAAARSIVGHAKNGWKFWSFNGVSLGSLRDKLAGDRPPK